MDILDENYLSMVAAYLTDDTIKILSHSNAKLYDKINKMKSNPLFWKEHFEIELGKTVPDRTDIDWRKIYIDFIHAKQKGKHYIIDLIVKILNHNYDYKNVSTDIEPLIIENYPYIVELLLSRIHIHIKKEIVLNSAWLGHLEMFKTLLASVDFNIAEISDFIIQNVTKHGYLDFAKYGTY
jgi:hypothetical protein